MKTVTEGTSVRLSVLVKDETGAQVIPTDFKIWAKNSGYGTSSVFIDGEVESGRVVGYFIPPSPGMWNIGIEVLAPVVVTQNAKLSVGEFSARP